MTYDASVFTDERTRTGDVTFGIAFAIALAFFLWILEPFFQALLLSVVIVVVSRPLHQRLLRLVGQREALAAVLASTATLLFILIPLAVLVALIAKEAIAVISALQDRLGEGGLVDFFSFGDREPPAFVARLEELGLRDVVLESLRNFGQSVSGRLAPAVLAATNLGIGAFLLVIGTYFFFLDGSRLLEELRLSLPFERHLSQKIIRSLGDFLRQLVLASYFASLVQWILGAAAFRIVDLPYAALWAALMAFFSLIISLVPLLGAALVWVPVAVWLALAGRPIAALFIVGWGLVVLGAVDSFLRPAIARAHLRLPPFLFLLTLLGGIQAFGPLGVIFGPLVGALTVTVLRLWRREVLPSLRVAEPEPAPVPPGGAGAAG